MAAYDYREVKVVYVGDTGPAMEFAFRKPNGRDMRDLTGYSAWVTFWYPGSAPHVVRAAAVGGSNGIVAYELRGDEYPLADEFGVIIQPTVMSVGTDATLQYFYQHSFPPVRRIVKRRPT